MQRSKASPEDIRCFAAGGRDLGRLDRDIDDLILQHDQWQKIDDLMRRIDNNGKGKPSDLEFAWPKLSSLLQKQLEGIDALFRQEIAEAFAELRDNMTSPDPDAKIEPFRLLRGSAGNWFYKVDLRLLEICRELIPIDAALAVVLAALEDASDEPTHVS
jgi:hypothetical protein